MMRSRCLCIPASRRRETYYIRAGTLVRYAPEGSLFHRDVSAMPDLRNRQIRLRRSEDTSLEPVAPSDAFASHSSILQSRQRRIPVALQGSYRVISQTPQWNLATLNTL